MTRFKAAAARLPIMLLMAQRKRAKGRRDPKSGHVDPFYDRRKRFESLLRPLGLAERFARMPRKFQELFWRFKMPDLAFDFPPEVSRGPLGKALGKQTLYAQLDRPEADAYAIALEVMAAASQTPAAREGMTAFLDKRRPDWRD